MKNKYFNILKPCVDSFVENYLRDILLEDLDVSIKQASVV